MIGDRDTAAPLALSARLRDLRSFRGWTLAELSRRARLSRPYLSRLEGGSRQPSLAALLALAQAYQMPLQSLVDTRVPDRSSPVQSSPVMVSSGRTQIRRGNGLRYRTVSGGGPWVHLNAMHVTVPHSRRRAPLARHDGEELLYVLAGSLNLIFEHQTHLLGPGDSAHFDARIPHRLAAAGIGDTDVLLVAYVPPADQTEAAEHTNGNKPVPHSTRGKAAMARPATVTICSALAEPPV
jgi:quercetin dioxygenase-like cupin family protein